MVSRRLLRLILTLGASCAFLAPSRAARTALRATRETAPPAGRRERRNAEVYCTCTNILFCVHIIYIYICIIYIYIVWIFTGMYLRVYEFTDQREEFLVIFGSVGNPSWEKMVRASLGGCLLFAECGIPMSCRAELCKCPKCWEAGADVSKGGERGLVRNVRHQASGIRHQASGQNMPTRQVGLKAGWPGSEM